MTRTLPASDAAIAEAYREHLHYFPDLHISARHWIEKRAREIEQGRDGLPELPSIGELLPRLLVDDPVFSAWRNTVPDKHWVTKDLTALRIGYELGKACRRAPDEGKGW